MKDEADTRYKLDRLHSLLFGIENTLAKGDHETALGLGLRLLGFLASERKTPEDEAYARKILSGLNVNLESARRATESDRDVLELANCSQDFRFKQRTPINLERIKRSKFLASVVPPTGTLRTGPDPRIEPAVRSDSAISLNINTAGEGPGSNNLKERSPPNPSRSLSQSKLTSLYVSGGRSSEKCRLPIVRVGSASSQELNNKASTSRPLSLQRADVVLPDSCTSGRDDEDDEVGRKRGRDFYSNRAFPRKAKPTSEDDSDEETALGRRFKSRARPVLRGDYSDDDTVRRYPNSKRREKMKAENENDDDEDDVQEAPKYFVTAKQQLALDAANTNNTRTSTSYQGAGHNASNVPNGGGQKTLGMSRRGARGAFVPPVKFGGGSGSMAAVGASRQQSSDDATQKCMQQLCGPDGELPDRLRNLEPKLLEHISNEIMDQDPNVRWDDIAGLHHAKKCVTEMVIWPLLRPDIFQGCRSPGKGLLLFGPPGTGKTMIGKAIAGEAKATFFSISASSLTSKWIGEGEKLVRALFGVASCRQPAVIFIDEVDSLLSQRKSDGEHESSRRLKTQFLIEMEGCGSGSEQILLIGATNRPQELDEAARRRLSKRLYIPLPSAEARAWIVQSLLQKDGLLTLSDDDVDAICTSTDGYSGSDMKNLVKEASMGPLREALMDGKDISKISNSEMRPITLKDFGDALQQVRPSVSQSELGLYEDWNRQFGSLAL